MILAAMSSEVQAILFLVAVVCFLVAAFVLVIPKVNLIALGLAFFVFVFMYNAFDAA